MNFRFSGHESFPLRYTWLPKVYEAVAADHNAFADESRAMVVLGIGKNMVRAIRFWMQATGVVVPSQHGGYEASDFGETLLGENGYDRYLEDLRTLWLIHWQLSTQVSEPLFAWFYLLNRWHEPEFSRSEMVSKFEAEAQKQSRGLSRITLEQHFDVFLHTYVPPRARRRELQEDDLDCPLTELHLIEQVGERKVTGTNRSEPVFSFRRNPKPEITSALFVYCLSEFWTKHYSNEMTLSFRDAAIGTGSPGQVLKLTEWELRDRLESLEEDSGGLLQFIETSSLRQLRRIRRDPLELMRRELLARIYQTEAEHV